MSSKHRPKERNRWEFTARERRAVLFMLPLIGALAWLTTEALRPRFGDSALLLGDTLAERSGNTGTASDREEIKMRTFPFDPNEVSYEELRSLGIDRKTAAGIIKYRESGKVFSIPEDFALCYGISDSVYAVLKPYIIIGADYRIKKRPAETRANSSGARQELITETYRAVRNNVVPSACLITPFNPNLLDAAGFEALGFTPKQAKAIINFREASGGFRTAEDFGKSYVVSGETYQRLKDYIIIPSQSTNVANIDRQYSASQVASDEPAYQALPLELNGADSATLVALRGIGPKTASAIVSYRSRLGGYCDAKQLLETGVITERNWELMMGQIWADSCAIRKIDINFASSNTIAAHPYIKPRTLRRILRNRQLKGGWSTIEDMVEDNTLTKEEAAKLAPYLHFGTIPSQ